jgi:1,2-diacylglycerol 3-alpha-glucosyltransferase
MDQSVKTIVKKISKVLCESCDEFTTPSEKTKDALRSYGVERYINVVPNGIDLEKFERSKENEDRIKRYRKEHDLEDTKILLSLGRVAQEKSIDVLIKGYSLFLAKKPSIKTKLLIVGDGPDRANLEKLVCDLNIVDNVEFIGKVPYQDVPFFYQLADLYLSASTSETQGLTFIESIASKTLVLCRFDENLIDIIKENITGFYFSSEENFALKVEQILQMSKEEIEKIKNVAYKINNKYSLESFYENMMEVYKRARRKKW